MERVMENYGYPLPLLVSESRRCGMEFKASVALRWSTLIVQLILWVQGYQGI